MLKFATKIVLLSILDQKLEKTILIFGISILEFAEMQKIVQNKEKIKFGAKITVFGYFGL